MCQLINFIFYLFLFRVILKIIKGDYNMSNDSLKNKNEVIDIDIDAIKGIFSKVDFSFSSSASLYSDEYLTQSYISNLYKELENIKNLFNQMRNIAINYGINVETIPAANPPIKGVVNTDLLNLRSDASIESKKIDLLSRGEKFTVLDNKNGNNGENDDWVQVETSKGKIGYVNKEYIKIIDDNNK